MGTHKPWFIGIAKVILTDIAVLGMHYLLFSTAFIFYPLAAICSIVYVQIFKCLWHWGPMHWYPSKNESVKRYFRSLKILNNSFLRSVHSSHASHHASFKKGSFQSRDPKKLSDIVSDIHIFPILLTAHYIALLIFIPWHFIPTIILAMSVWFAMFEATHWFAHVKDNAVDRTLRRVPLLGYFWVDMFEYHTYHHGEYDEPGKESGLHNAFNFVFPYLGDRILGTYVSPRVGWDWKKWTYYAKR